MPLRLAISVTIFLLNSYVVSSIFSLNGALVKSSFQHEILHLHRSKGDTLRKQEFPGQYEKVGTYL